MRVEPSCLEQLFRLATVGFLVMMVVMVIRHRKKLSPQ